MSRQAQPVPGVPVVHVGDMAVLDVGAGPPIVFVPGYTGSKEDFGPLLAPLASAGYRVIAFDQRGQYQSPARGDLASYTPGPLAADLVGLLDRLGLQRVHLVGHSFGGLVARAAVLAAPARFASLVLLCSGPAGLTGPRARATRALRPVLQDGGVARVWELLSAEQEGSDFARRRFLAQDPVALSGMGEAVLDEPDRVDELAERCRAAGIPVLVACGEQDDAWPVAAQREMARRLAAPFRSVPGAGHSPAVEAPADTARLLRAFYADPAAGLEDAPGLDGAVGPGSAGPGPAAR